MGNLVVKEPEYGSGERAVPIQQENEVKYIRITDFDDHGIVPGNEFMTAKSIDEKYRLEEGDILFARSGATAGKTFIYTSDIGPAIFAGYCIRFRFDRSRVLPWFIYFYTKTSRYKAWVRSIQRPAGQPNINRAEFKSFTVPVPPLEKQHNLVAEMQAARKVREQKLKEADALLSGIDEFMHGQLGIALSPAEALISEGKPQCFAVRRGEVAERLDPKFIIFGGHNLLKGVKTQNLGRLVVKEPEYGSGERAVPIQHENEVKYIRITDFDNEGIVPGNKFMTAESVDEKYLLEEGDILFARSGATAGKTFIYTSDIGPAIFAGYCILFRFDLSIVLPQYIYFYTKTARYRRWVQSMQRPSGQPNINKEEFKSFTVPIPPLDTQKRIVEELSRRRAEARRLREEAAKEWEAAKARFEAQLLSGEVS